MTPREQQVCDLLLRGYGNAEIAKEMGIRERTVKAYFHRLFIRNGFDGATKGKRIKLAVMLTQTKMLTEGECHETRL